MSCTPEVLRQVPLFSLLDDDEIAVLAGQVEVRTFAPRQRIWKIGDSSGPAYVMVSGAVRLTTVDEDQQEVLVDEPVHGEFFGFASLLDQTAPLQAIPRKRAPKANFYVLRRLFQKEKLEKVFVERLTEPLHLNILSAFVALFGAGVCDELLNLGRMGFGPAEIARVIETGLAEERAVR